MAYDRPAVPGQIAQQSGKFVWERRGVAVFHDQDKLAALFDQGRLNPAEDIAVTRVSHCWVFDDLVLVRCADDHVCIGVECRRPFQRRRGSPGK